MARLRRAQAGAGTEEPPFGVWVLSVSNLAKPEKVFPLPTPSPFRPDLSSGLVAAGLLEVDRVSGNWYRVCDISSSSLRTMLQIDAPDGKVLENLPIEGSLGHLCPCPQGNSLLAELNAGLVLLRYPSSTAGISGGGVAAAAPVRPVDLGRP